MGIADSCIFRPKRPILFDGYHLLEVGGIDTRKLIQERSRAMKFMLMGTFIIMFGIFSGASFSKDPEKLIDFSQQAAPIKESPRKTEPKNVQTFATMIDTLNCTELQLLRKKLFTRLENSETKNKSAAIQNYISALDERREAICSEKE